MRHPDLNTAIACCRADAHRPAWLDISLIVLQT